MVRISLYFLFIFPLTTSAQHWEFTDPQKLSSQINTEYEESFPLLSPDGKTLYFTRILSPQNKGGKYTGSDIWTSEFINNTWYKAKHLNDIFNNIGNNAVIGIRNDGHVLYLLNATSNKKIKGIYFSTKHNNQWSTPEFIAIPGIQSEGNIGFYVSPDYDVIFLSMKAHDCRGEEDLYVSFKASGNHWTIPKNLGASINTSGFEISPFLSQDKKRLFFSSNGHKGLGDADIFYADRLYNSWDTWSVPRNLGDKLNSKNFDAYFSLYGDSLAYFSSNRHSKYADIYTVKVLPGEGELPFGQNYLSKEETTKILGAGVSRNIQFKNTKTDLSSVDKELLFFIANKLNIDRSVNIQLLITEENIPNLSETRTESIVSQLRESGFEISRILVTSNSINKKQNPLHTTVELYLFR